MRLEADAVRPNLRPVHLGSALSSISRQFEPEAAANGVTIKVAVSSKTVLVDGALLDRAISNLLANALIHAGARTILLGVKSVRRESARIYVIDDGVGVSPKDASVIFEDYTQGDITHSKVRGGFGLGLASVRRIARLLGGGAGLNGQWKSGAAFFIELPLTSGKRA
jgi:signal transduction histidine kinase